MPGKTAQTEIPIAGIQQHTFLKTDGLGTFCVIPGRNAVIFSSRHNSGDYNLYMKGIYDDKTIQLTSSPSNEAFPAVSPDSGMLAFCSDKDGHWTLQIMRLDAGINVYEPLFEDPQADIICPSWSPDSKKIAFSRYSDELEDWEICMLEFENSGRKTPKMILKFTGITGLFPKWPRTDSNRIVFQSASRATGWFGLYIHELKEGRTTEIVSDPSWAAIDPAWSDDGKFVTFATVNKSHNAAADPDNDIIPKADNIWAYEVAGSRLYQLTSDNHSKWHPVWCNDRLLFCRAVNDVTNIWSIRPEIR